MTPDRSQDLSSAGAQRRLRADGQDVLPAAQPCHTLAIAYEVVREPMFPLLIGGAIIFVSICFN